jgi:hypothetical protein
MGIWQPPLIASQLTIDAFGGVATGRRMEKKKHKSGGLLSHFAPGSAVKDEK